MVRLLHSYLLIGLISMLTACSLKEGLRDKPLVSLWKESPIKEGPKPVWITVWVHGTQPCLETPHETGLRASIKKVAEQIFYCKQGLHPIEVQSQKNRHYAISKLLAKEDPINFPEKNFYTFGWSGNLSFQARQEAAEILYQDLTTLVDRYTNETGTKPHIRVISHSHGGNVVLNLAPAEQKHKKNLVIDELVLLACPVQQETSPFVHTCIFPNIYSFYSSLDFIQRLDPQGLYRNKKDTTPLFSQQLFPACSKVTQAKVQFGKRGALHLEFLSDRFLHALPDLLKILDSTYQGKLVTIGISSDTVTVSSAYATHPEASQEVETKSSADVLTEAVEDVD